MGTTGAIDCDGISDGQVWSSSLRVEDDASDSLYAATVWFERSGDGRVFEDHPVDAPPIGGAIARWGQCYVGDSEYLGVDKRAGTSDIKAIWRVAMKPSQRRAINNKAMGKIIERLEKLKALTHAIVEHPFRVIKCQFGHRKIRHKGLAKNITQILTLFTLIKVWMVRKKLMMTQNNCVQKGRRVPKRENHIQVYLFRRSFNQIMSQAV